MTDVKLYLADREVREKRNRRRLRFLLLTIFFGGILWTAWWGLFRSPMFRVTDIRVHGNRRVSVEDVVQFLQNSVPQESRLAGWFGTTYIWAWPTGVFTNGLETLPRVKKLLIEKSYRSRTVDVTIEERDPYGVWCLKKKIPPSCFWFETDGTVFEPAPEVEGSLIKIVADYASEELQIGQEVLRPPFMPALAAMLDVLTKAPLDVKEVRYEEPSLQEIKVLTYDGPQLYFSLRFPAENALAVIDSLIKKDQAGVLIRRFKDLQYIDFRVQNRAYYK